MSPNLVDATELASILRVTRKTVIAWARRGRIPCVRPTLRTVLFDPQEVLAQFRVAKATGQEVSHAAG